MLRQVNIIAADFEATIAAYRALGLDIADAEEWPPGTGGLHTHAVEDDGAAIDFDNVAMARMWAPEWDDPAGIVLSFYVPSAEEVDRRYADAVAAGWTSRQSPYDAFFGARYAIVEDADGNVFGFMGPRDRSQGYVPQP
jgi:uncharacterized glyoxalase superfamily protein PhnB